MHIYIYIFFPSPPLLPLKHTSHRHRHTDTATQQPNHTHSITLHAKQRDKRIPKYCCPSTEPQLTHTALTDMKMTERVETQNPVTRACREKRDQRRRIHEFGRMKREAPVPASHRHTPTPTQTTTSSQAAVLLCSIFPFARIKYLLSQSNTRSDTHTRRPRKEGERHNSRRR